MTLTAITAYAEDMLEQLFSEYDHRNIAVAWTGGKDSTVTLHMWKCLLQRKGVDAVRVLTVDTGVKFPQVLAFRDTLAAAWQLDMHIATPDIALEGYPLAQDPIRCCGDLKVEPLSRAVATMGVDVLLTGIRRDEHPDRERPDRERRERPAVLMVHPILAFTEMDIWAYTVENRLPWCTLYGEGYRSLGCVPCTAKVQPGDGAHERAGRAAEKEANMERLRSMGYF